jgi:hypothetical protein
MHPFRSIPLRLLPLLAALLIARPAQACSIPVFRFALERWPVDPYDVYVFRRGPLSDEHKALLERLEGREKVRPVRSNVRVLEIDLDGSVDAGSAELFKAQRDAKLPWMVVRYPEVGRTQGTVFAGPLSASAVNTLLDSPARREMAKRLTSGESSVWVLVEVGDKAADDAAAAVLARELPILQRELKLPEPEFGEAADDKPDPTRGPPLRVAFSFLRVSPTDPAEAMFIEMLMNTEADLKGLKQPTAFAVFGRGRAAEALVGPGISAENIADVAKFLIGPCSCQVKRLAPGTDLLTATDWPAELAAAAPPAAREPAAAGRDGAGTPKAPVAAGPAPKGDGNRETTPAVLEPGTPDSPAELAVLESEAEGIPPLTWLAAAAALAAVITVWVALRHGQ